eukprot:TRINITY_DN1010_c1_g1_i1.p1 TRINITY_DN1010_c1_g1~~TRINITY_DN1010_c1_g1_i1.p1  ORF type:complete len:292 (+),score=76.54 TRINITY_DN1010_c1_g1_i1:329-1204(+)
MEVQRLKGEEITGEMDEAEQKKLNEHSTPAEREYARAVALHHLPRSISEESLCDDAYGWRHTLELRENAVSSREELLLKKEAEVKRIQAMEQELEQQIRELKGKEKEYKLRFRGIEDREERQGRLPEILAELTEREEHLAEREEALDNRESELLDREQELNDRLESIEQQECSLLERETNVAERENALPKILTTYTVTVPEKEEFSGDYVESSEKLRGRPSWVSSKGTTLYHEQGRWSFSLNGEIDDGIVWIVSTATNRGGAVLPHDIDSWDLYGDDSFTTDSSITVVLKE